ncbi:MAG TPA: rhomboid family intramembrane serine protease [Bacteroidetes bacterium]|nr:rhomboid family intramembrane serine protease [Bacteroidota bacterium]
METEKKRLFGAAAIPLILLVLMWAVELIHYAFGINFFELGVHPLHWDGLPGILLMPFVHGGFKHLIANSFPFLILGTALFYFYREISLKVLIGIWLLSGIWVWFGGRDSWHIGVSGVIYGLSSFLFFSGLIRKNVQLSALALVVAFLYGSMIWGIFPDFFPEKNISWEGHLGGLVAGIILAFYYRKSGPQRKRYSWEFEDDDEDDDENSYWNPSKKNVNTT